MKKKVDPYFLFGLCPFLELRPFEKKNVMKSFKQDI